MLTRIDIATFDPRYRRFRAELRRATDIDAEAVAAWMTARRDRLARDFAAMPDSETASLHDYAAWIRQQYAQAMGKAV